MKKHCWKWLYWLGFLIMGAGFTADIWWLIAVGIIVVMVSAANISTRYYKKLFRVTVDYTKTLVEMIKAGNYDWVDSDITDKNFPLQGQGQVELNIKLINYGKFMDSAEIIRDLDNRGLRPATLPELLAFGSKYPEKQREFPIVALGSLWRYWHGPRSVECLRGSGSKRILVLGTWGGGWNGYYHYAALRK